MPDQQNLDDLYGMVAPQPEPQGLLARHFWKKHTAETNAHNMVIREMAAAAHDPQLQSPEAAHLLNSTLYSLSGKKPSDNAKFLQEGKLQQILDQAGQMEKQAREQIKKSAPPASTSLSSQPINLGGANYGRFAAPQPPPDAFGQQSAPAQQVSPQQEQFTPPAPPPGPEGMMVPSLGPGVGLGPVRTGFDRSQLANAQEVQKKGAEYQAQYAAQYSEQTKGQIAQIEARKQILAQNQDLLGELEPFEQAQFILGGTIARPIQNRTTFGPSRKLTDDLKKAFPLDAVSQLPLEGAQAKPVLLNGQVVGYTAAEQPDSMVGSSPVFNDKTGKWEIPLRSRVTGQAGASQVLPGAPLGAVVAATPSVSQNTSQSEVFLPTPDGGFVAMPKTTSSQSASSRAIPGVATNPFISPAGPPGTSTQTTQPPDASASKGRTGRPIAGAGRPADPTTQREIGSLTFALKQAKDINDLLIDPKYENAREAFGPASGRITLAEINKLGGSGSTPQQVQLAVKLQRFLSSQAFSDGGKQLTPTELVQFELVSPAITDTLETALRKTKDAISFLEDRRKARLDVLPEVQRAALMKQLGIDMKMPSPPPGGGSVPKTAAEYLKSIGH